MAGTRGRHEAEPCRRQPVQRSLPFVASDMTVLDLLRQRGRMTVAQLAQAMDVTPTAVRQRLQRLLAQQLVHRYVQRRGRGRPVHFYRLTRAGRRKLGANLGDLAMVLWEEIRAIDDPDIRRGLIARLASRLAEHYGIEVRGATVADRMRSVVDLFARREVPFEVDHDGGAWCLRALSCPYPELAEQDRAVCAMERLMLSELLGATVRLDACRLEGAESCTFLAEQACVPLEGRWGGADETART